MLLLFFEFYFLKSGRSGLACLLSVEGVAVRYDAFSVFFVNNSTIGKITLRPYYAIFAWTTVGGQCCVYVVRVRVAFLCCLHLRTHPPLAYFLAVLMGGYVLLSI